jgi:hypothetical protein
MISRIQRPVYDPETGPSEDHGHERREFVETSSQESKTLRFEKRSFRSSEQSMDRSLSSERRWLRTVHYHHKLLRQDFRVRISFPAMGAFERDWRPTQQCAGHVTWFPSLQLPLCTVVAYDFIPRFIP